MVTFMAANGMMVMEHIAALLLVIGCSDDLQSCKELPAPIPVFETAQECETQLPGSFKVFIGKYPQVFAQCLAVNPEMEETDADLVWDIKPDGTLVASVEEPTVQYAGAEDVGGNVTASGRGSRLQSSQQ